MSGGQFPVFRDSIGLHLMKKRETTLYAVYLGVCLTSFLLSVQLKPQSALDTNADYSFFFMHLFILFAGILLSVYQSVMEMSLMPASSLRGWFDSGARPLAVLAQKTAVYLLTSGILVLLSLPFAVVQAAAAGIDEIPVLRLMAFNLVLYASIRFMGLFFTLLHRTKEFSFAFSLSVLAIAVFSLSFLSTFLLPQASPVGALLALNNPALGNLSETRFFQLMKISASLDFSPGVYWTGLILNSGLCVLSGVLSFGLLYNYDGKSKGDKARLGP
jgi:hypothetical protein